MLSLIYFSVAWLGFLYLFNSAIARSFKKVRPNIVLLYISSLALIGVFGHEFIARRCAGISRTLAILFISIMVNG